MASRQDVTNADRRLLQYINEHVRFWSAAELALRFGLGVDEMRARLDGLVQGGYLRQLEGTPARTDPTFTLTGKGIQAAVS